MNDSKNNTGEENTGDLNTGYWNTGAFNTTTPETANYFNMPCNISDWDNATKPNWIYVPSPTTWVSEDDMTDVEKTENTAFHTTGGYLRTNDMAEEWHKAMDGATSEEIQMVRDLPNFNTDVFKEITGLDLSAQDAPGNSCTNNNAENKGCE